MELAYYWRVINRRRWTILLTMIIALTLVAIGTRRMARTYSATAVVRVAGKHDPSVTPSDLNYADRLQQTYVFLLKSRPILDQLNARLNLQGSADALASAITIEAPIGTELIRINAISRDPRQAAAIANTLAQILIQQGQVLYAGQGRSAPEVIADQLNTLKQQLQQDRALQASSAGKGQPDDPQASAAARDLAARIGQEETSYATLLNQYDQALLGQAMQASSVSVAEPAVEPTRPVKPNVPLNLALAGMVGLLGGLGLAFLFDSLDPAIHAAEDLETRLPAPLLGEVPRFDTGRDGYQKALVARTGRSQVDAAEAFEAFRMLSVNIMASLAPGDEAKVVLVSSAEPGTGKSLVSANLAMAMAQDGRRVVLADGDLRNPTLNQILQLPQTSGLQDALLDPSRLGEVLQPTALPGVLLLSGGSAGAHAGFLRAPALAALVAALRERADVVLWDGPPILAAADAAMLAATVDGVVLVARRDHTSLQLLDQAHKALDRVGARLLGLVFNEGNTGSLRVYLKSDYRRKKIAPAATGWAPAPTEPKATDA